MKPLLLLLSLIAASAHELEDNRATLVLRDKTHIAITLHLNFPELLHRALAPQRTYTEFVVAFSTLPPAQVQRELQRVQAKWEAATKFPGLQLSSWTWPDPKQVHDLFQQAVMQAVVGGKNHAHSAPMEVHADAVSPQPITSVRVQFPDEFQKVLVVSYRPTETWVDPKSLSTPIPF